MRKNISETLGGLLRCEPRRQSRTGEETPPISRTVCLPLALTFLLVMAPSAWAKKSANKFDAEVAVAWFDLLYDVVKAENLSPPVAARAYGIASVTLYEAIIPGSPHYRDPF